MFRAPRLKELQNKLGAEKKTNLSRDGRTPTLRQRHEWGPGLANWKPFLFETLIYCCERRLEKKAKRKHISQLMIYEISGHVHPHQ